MANDSGRRGARQGGSDGGGTGAGAGAAPGKRTLAESRYAGTARPPRADAPEAGHAGAEPTQKRSTETPRVQATQVTSVFRKGSTTPETSTGGYAPRSDAVIARQRVAPTGAPVVSAGGGNSCTPGVEVLDWTVADAGANWRADVTALRVSADIHITAWPSAPAAMTVPNTANPVDGGNINNTAGSANHWQAVINDMADYDTAGGGAGPDWHSTAASTAHEWSHWNHDYLAGCIPAGNWAQTNQDIDALTVPKAGNADAAAARAALQPRVQARFQTFVDAVTVHWNNTITAVDVPGAGGGGYAAGARVLSGLIASVRAYADGKGWTRPAAPAGNAPAHPHAGGAGNTPAHAHPAGAADAPAPAGNAPAHPAGTSDAPAPIANAAVPAGTADRGP